MSKIAEGPAVKQNPTDNSSGQPYASLSRQLAGRSMDALQSAKAWPLYHEIMAW